MYLQVSEKVVYGLSYVALYIIYSIYLIYIHPLNNLYAMNYLRRLIEKIISTTIYQYKL